MIIQIKAGMGDEIGSEPLAREIAERTGKRVIVDGRQPWFWQHHPKVTFGTEGARPSDGPMVTLNPLWRPGERIGNFAASFAAQVGFTPIYDPTPRMYLTGEEVMGALEAHFVDVPPGAPVVVFHYFAGWPSRRWPFDRFVEVVKRLKVDGCYTIEIGSTMYDCAGEVYNTGRLPVDLQLFGKTTQRGAAAVLHCADLLVSPDCGPFHLAAAVGTPQVTILGVKPWYSRAYWNTTPVYPHQPCETSCDGWCYRERHCLTTDVPIDYVMSRIYQAFRRFSRKGRDSRWGLKEG